MLLGQDMLNLVDNMCCIKPLTTEIKLKQTRNKRLSLGPAMVGLLVT